MKKGYTALSATVYNSLYQTYPNLRQMTETFFIDMSITSWPLMQPFVKFNQKKRFMHITHRQRLQWVQSGKSLIINF